MGSNVSVSWSSVKVSQNYAILSFFCGMPVAWEKSGAWSSEFGSSLLARSYFPELFKYFKNSLSVESTSHVSLARLVRYASMVFRNWYSSGSRL